MVVELDPGSGRVTAVLDDGEARAGSAEGESAGLPEVVDLPGKALLPGFVNAHSHAFQRLIRGRTQRPRTVAASGGPDSWSWREAM
jgi:formimidoylglutamate deiminase